VAASAETQSTCCRRETASSNQTCLLQVFSVSLHFNIFRTISENFASHSLSFMILLINSALKTKQVARVASSPNTALFSSMEQLYGRKCCRALSTCSSLAVLKCLILAMNSLDWGPKVFIPWLIPLRAVWTNLILSALQSEN